MCPTTATVRGSDVRTEMTSTWSASAPRSQRAPRNGSAATRPSEPPVRGTRAMSASAHSPRNTSDHLQLSWRRRRPIVAVGEPGDEGLARQWTGEVVALYDVGTHHREHLPGHGVLDAFGGDGQAELMGQVDRGSDDDLVLRVLAEHRDERAVDLELVDGQPLEIGQR